MPKTGHTFIDKFLLPSLNSEKFGSRLMWLDHNYDVFQLQWNHKSASDWTSDDAEVFVEWDKIKKRYHPDNKEYFSKSKQRFRAILYKLIKGRHITELESDDKYTKVYCIGDRKNLIGYTKGKKEVSIEEKCEFDPESFLKTIESVKLERVAPEESVMMIQCDTIFNDHMYTSNENHLASDNEASPNNYDSDGSFSLYPLHNDEFEGKPTSLLPVTDSYSTNENDVLHVDLVQLNSTKLSENSLFGMENSLQPYYEDTNLESIFTLYPEDRPGEWIKIESLEYCGLEYIQKVMDL